MRFQRKAFLPSAFTFKRHGHDNWCGHVLLAIQRFKLQSTSFQIESKEALYPVVGFKVVSNLDIALLNAGEF